MNRFVRLAALATGSAALALTFSLPTKAQIRPVEKVGAGTTSVIDQPGAPIRVGASYQNDTSPRLQDIPPAPYVGKQRHMNKNPKIPHKHLDEPDRVVQTRHLGAPETTMPAPILNFDGIGFPGVACNCAPPDTDGEVGATQYVQLVNEGLQVFNKSTGASVLGPIGIQTVWTGFGGVCETSGHGDPVVLYDQINNRWLISQFAGSSTITDECVAVSTSSDATGSWYRYGFHLGENFFDYPHIGVWRDAYYMSMNVFNAAGTAFLGPQPFAFDRTAMLAGSPATFITPGITVGPSEEVALPADLDGLTLPAAGTPATFVEFPGGGAYKLWHFHVDFATPANTTFTLFASPTAAGFTALCPSTQACVPEPGGQAVDGLGDRLMFRLAYRKFADHESVVGNFSVSANGVSGIRWFELRNVTAGPVTVYQESTYQPDTDWRWMGSAAMDTAGNLALGYSASSASIYPQIRYAGRLVGDALNTLAQAEVHLFDGTGSQSGTGNRWGDYSDLTVDPVDDCTFWYTQEYIPTNGTFNWKTRIGSFKFPSCVSVPAPLLNTNGWSLTNENCAPSNGVIDPGETDTVTLNVSNLGSAATSSSLVGTLLNTGGVTGASGAQTYGVIAPGGSVSRSFSFTASGTCGGTVTASLHMQDGASDLGTLAYTFTLGVLNTTTTFSEGYDGVTAPTLPAGWTTSTTVVSGTPWVTSTTSPFAGVNDAFAPDPTAVGLTELTSPTIAVPAAGAQLTFKNNYATEGAYDGMVLEISIGGGAYADITAGGNTFISGGYNATISSSFGNPLAGRSAWSGSSSGYVTSSINLPAAANGQNVQLKWRMGSDTSVSSTGVRIDSLTVARSGYTCSSCGAPAVTPVITWANPASIAQGTALSGTQLNATASYGGNPVAGSFVYSPPSGTVLPAGTGQALSTTFTPTDTGSYTTATKSVTIDVTVAGKSAPVIIWADPANITQGTALSATQLNATLGGVGAPIPSFGVSAGAGVPPAVRAQQVGTSTPNQYYTANTLRFPDGTDIDQTIINGPPKPPPGFDVERQPVPLPTPNTGAGINTLIAPAFNWVFGCSSVSGAMIAGYYDRSGWPNMYTGPTNGGVMPLTNASWGTWSDGVDTYPNCPLIASHNGVDGRATKGSIDDYWVQYGSSASDPYITGAWTQHTWADAIGDYMKTSQSAYGNTDGSTQFYNWTSSATQLTCDTMDGYGITNDGTVGRRAFYQARGYTVTACYNQKTDNTIAGGFSFAQFMAEIDAGRPVMLNLAGHTIIGVGYDASSNTVYIHDTWDYLNHSFTWGTSYSGMGLLSVSIVNIQGPSTLSGTFVYTPPAGTVLSAGTHTLSVTFTPTDTANYIPATKTVTIIVTGGSGFTDTLVPGVTPVKAIHVAELRSRIDALRARFGLGAYSWTNTTLTGTLIKAAHVVEMRTALAQAYAAHSMTPPNYTDPSLGAGSIVKAVHITELRAAVITLEGS